MNEPVVASQADTGFLANLDNGRKALEAAVNDFQRLQVRDTAAAIAAAAEVMKRTDVQVLASVLVAEAERAIAKANPAKTLKRKAEVDSESTSSASSIPKDTLYQMRRAHKLDDESFEAAKAEAREAGVPLTRAKLIETVKKQERAENKEQADALRANPKPLPAGIYSTVVIDPPWPMEVIQRDVAPAEAPMDYPVMTVDEIKAIDVPGVLNDDALVFLWCNQKHLPAAIWMLPEWGLTYQYVMVWHKTNGGMKVWNRPTYDAEFVVVGSVGKPKLVDESDFRTVFAAKRGAHSEKPEVFYEIIKRVTPERRLDMFARTAHDGFDSWGNEAPETEEGNDA